MALSKPSSELSKLFRCGICSETLKSPKILPCLHNFCAQCIHEFILTMGRKKDNKLQEFNCPVCRTVVIPTNRNDDIAKWSSNLQDNVVIATMITVAIGENQPECHPCKRHEQKVEAKFWCKECEEAYCAECNSKHSWMKSSHQSVPIEDFGSSSRGIDLKAIKETCLNHPPKPVDIFCLDHTENCCNMCLLYAHRDCKNVQAIEKTCSETTKREFQQSLVDMKDATTELWNLKEKQHKESIACTEKTENAAAKFIETVKCKLDNLFETFIKQLHMCRDEQTTKHNVRMRFITQLISSLDHWIDATKVVNEIGTTIQVFIHMESARKQLKYAFEELHELFKNDELVNVVTINEKLMLNCLKAVEDLGTFCASSQKIKDQLNGFDKFSKQLGFKCFPSIEEIKVDKIQCVHFPGSNLRCGVSVDNERMVIGDASSQKRLLLVHKNSLSIISSTTFPGNIKRLCYDKMNKQILIPCHSRELYSCELKEQIQNPIKMAFISELVGGACVDDGYVYIVVSSDIKKFLSTETPTGSNKMSDCFATNANCSSDLDVRCGNLIYTTINKEIKCSTKQGGQIFCFKHAAIKDPKSISSLSSGLTIVLDNADEGVLHVISADGKTHRTILNKFEKITNAQDIWLDIDDETLYVTGGEYVEVYRINSV